MRRALATLASLVLLASVIAAPASAVGAARAYLIGSAAPLTAAQVSKLKAAGAQLKYVYRNFGGAAAVIPSTKVAAVRALRFVTSVNLDTVKQLDAVRVAGPAAPAGFAVPSALPGIPYWLDLIDAEANTTYTGDGVWVAVLDSGFYPNWRDYFDPDSILTDKARAFIAAGGNENLNQWDRGSDPHGMATAATIVGYRFVDDTNEGGWGTGFATGAAGTYWVPGVAPGAKVIPIKVCEPIGCFGSAINAGMDYVTSLKNASPTRPIVINESLGGPGLDPVEKAAIDAATDAGVVIVASAGNSGNAGMGFPAAYEPVVSVGAGGWEDQWTTLPSKSWWLANVPENGIDEVFVVNFSSRRAHRPVPRRRLDRPVPAAAVSLRAALQGRRHHQRHAPPDLRQQGDAGQRERRSVPVPVHERHKLLRADRGRDRGPDARQERVAQQRRRRHRRQPARQPGHVGFGRLRAEARGRRHGYPRPEPVDPPAHRRDAFECWESDGAVRSRRPATAGSSSTTPWWRPGPSIPSRSDTCEAPGASRGPRRR